MIVYHLELSAGPHQASRVRVERHVTRPATGLWNRLRRRRWITDVTIEGIYLTNVREFKMTRSTNQPGTLSMLLEGRDPLAALEQRPTR